MPNSPGTLRARRVGLMTMGVFTALWAVLGLVSGLPVLQAVAVAQILSAVVLLVCSARVAAPPQASPAGSHNEAARPAPSDPRFVIAVASEVVAIVIAVIVLLAVRLPQFVVPSVAVIVGAHFFFFVRRGDRWVHVVAGVAGIGVGLLGIALIAVGALDPVMVRGVVGCSFALITVFYGCYFLAWRMSGGSAATPR